MRQDIQRHFTALGLSPGASANDIRVAYRKLIQQWHPDRFAVGSLMQTTAEDHTKELNEAYEWLYKKRHYRKHLSPAAKGRPVARPAAGVAAEPEPKATETPRAAPRPSRRPSFRPSRRWWKIAALAAGLGVGACLVGFLLRRSGAAPGQPGMAATVPAPDTPTMATASPPAAAPSGAPAAAESPTAAPLSGNEPVRRRVPRSEVGRVALPETRSAGALDVRPRLAPEGVGTKALQPLGRDSEVTASGDGTVAVSENKVPEPSPVPPPDNFRRTDPPASAAVSAAEWDRRLDASEAELDTFAMGDSLERVKVVQGRPEETTTGAFRYGSSLVFFENGKVSGWIDGIPRLRIPRLGFAGWQNEIDAITLGSSRGEVFKIQGRPDEVFTDAYYYGTDAVFFSGDRVVNWIQTDDRLRTRWLPDLPFPNLPPPR